MACRHPEIQSVQDRLAGPIAERYLAELHVPTHGVEAARSPSRFPIALAQIQELEDAIDRYPRPFDAQIQVHQDLDRTQGARLVGREGDQAPDAELAVDHQIPPIDGDQCPA